MASRSGQVPVQIQKVYEEVKNFFRPVRLFEREFVIVPVYLPGHWAVSVVCRPQALVRELLGQHVGDRDIWNLPRDLIRPLSARCRLPPPLSVG